jgi:hypothetical protein
MKDDSLRGFYKAMSLSFVLSYLPRNSWLILAQPFDPCVKAAEGTA